MIDRVYSRTLQKAAELSGGQKKLARYLQVPLAELEKWLAGASAPPMNVFLRAVDFVLDETPSPASSSEPEEGAPPRDCAAAGTSSLLL